MTRSVLHRVKDGMRVSQPREFEQFVFAPEPVAMRRLSIRDHVSHAATRLPGGRPVHQRGAMEGAANATSSKSPPISAAFPSLT